MCRATRPHLVLLDIQIPCMDGFEMAEKLFAELPETRVLALTALKDNRTVGRVLESAFAGFVDSDNGGAHAVQGIQIVAVPEPRLFLLAALALGVFAFFRRRK